MTNDSDKDKTSTFTVLSKGTMVSHYRIVEKVGAGGMGEVYLADDTKLDRRVALKFLPGHIAHDADVRARFTREAQSAAKLDHPNIITIHEVSEFEKRPFFAMQYVDGKSVLHYCRNEKLSIAKVIELVTQIAEGLAKAHSAGVTHRDIKSANIIVDKEFRAKILDFGLAAVKGGEMITKTGSTLGTVAYMSPEQAQGHDIDNCSDLFSLGIVLYELLTGQTPFKRNNDAATLHAIVHDEPKHLAEYNPSVPAELQRIVSKCLAKDPQERYQSAVDLSNDLRKVTKTIANENDDAEISKQPSIAVLPFTNMSADKENEYFSDGLTEELLNVLAKNPGLKVTGRTSSFAFKNKQEDLRSIGQKLGVGTLLEGSVRKAGNRVRITAQLVKTSDGFHLWSETYDRVIDDIFAVQDDIAKSVAEAMHVTLLGKHEKTKAVNPESYALLLQGNQAMLEWNKESAQKAIELYKEAIELDKDNARAWAGLARVYTQQACYGLDDSETAYRNAKEAIVKALKLDDKLADAHEVMGLIKGALEFHFEEGGLEYRKAYELAPNNSRMVSSLALYYGIMGEYKEALRLSKLSVELDPLNPESHINLGRVLFWSGQYPESRLQYQKGLEFIPDAVSINGLIGWTYLLEGKLEEALEATQKEKGEGYRNCGLAMLYHALGKKKESDECLNSLLELSDRKSWAYQLALVYAYRDEKDKAFEWLEVARNSRDAGLPLAKIAVFFENLHSDPRWESFLKKAGFMV